MSDRLEKYNERAIVLASLAGATITPAKDAMTFPWELSYVDGLGVTVTRHFADAHYAAYYYCDMVKITIPWGD